MGCHFPQGSSALLPSHCLMSPCCARSSPGCVPAYVTAWGGLSSPPGHCGMKHPQGNPSPASHHGCWEVGVIPADPSWAELHRVPLVRETVWPKPILLQCNEWKREESIIMMKRRGCNQQDINQRESDKGSLLTGGASSGGRDGGSIMRPKEILAR